MDVTRYATAREFLADAEPFLLQAEVENSLILGIAGELANSSSELPVAPYFAVVRDDQGICVAAFRTLRTKLGVTRSRRDDALALLAADVNEDSPSLAGVLGPEPSAEIFAGQLAALRGASAELAISQRVYELREVVAPEAPPVGGLRQARPAEAGLLTGWIAGFLAEVRESGDPGTLVQQRLLRGQLFVWDDDGPRAMAAWAGKTPNGVRVNFVYTPLESRRRGYASACVAALSQRLLDEGNEHCCLYTDLSNPTSNSIYQKIGYRPVSDAGFYRLIDGRSASDGVRSLIVSGLSRNRLSPLTIKDLTPSLRAHRYGRIYPRRTSCGDERGEDRDGKSMSTPGSSSRQLTSSARLASCISRPAATHSNAVISAKAGTHLQRGQHGFPLAQA